jgi:hypothetical protein
MAACLHIFSNSFVTIIQSVDAIEPESQTTSLNKLQIKRHRVVR